MQTLTSVFMTVLNMSITGAVVTAVVVALRALFRHAPAPVLYALWILVLFRLVCPVSFTADFSLLDGLPKAEGGSTVAYVVYATDGNLETVDMTQDDAAASAGVAAADGALARADSIPHKAVTAATPLHTEGIAALVWLGGMAVPVLQSVLSWVRLKRRLSTAVRVEPGVYETDAIGSPFVLGILRPRIYVPAGLAGESRVVVLAHERTHIARHDTLVKPLAFVVRCVHWFNPFAWLAFVLVSRDMERSCDERTIREAGFERGEYSMTLLRFASPGRFPGKSAGVRRRPASRGASAVS